MSRTPGPLTKLDEATRAWLYRILTTVIGLLLILGFLAEDVAQQAMLIAAAVLGIGEGALASANTTTKRTGGDGPDEPGS